MLETNVRIVRPGRTLFVRVRHARVVGPNLTADLLERACGTLRHRHGLAAVRYPGEPATLLVATDRALEPIRLEGADWELGVSDSGEPTQSLTLDFSEGTCFMPVLIERALLAVIAQHGEYWRLDSPRIWYDSEPFVVRDGIAAYRRYEIGTVLISEVGIGLAVDVGTAFLSANGLDYFFDPSASASERERREVLFGRLTRRQQGQKGTLVYDNGVSRTKCYFEAARTGMTCETTGIVRVKGESFDSLLAYYRSRYPNLPVASETPAVHVSFEGIDRPQPIAATRAFVRVMNENVPDSLSSVDKIAPSQRRAFLLAFWSKFEPRPLGLVAPGLQQGFWRPPPDRLTQLLPPTLFFGTGKSLPAPPTASVEHLKDNFRKRSTFLRTSGCYAVPAAMARTLYCAYPDHLDRDIGERLACDLAEAVRGLTGKLVETCSVPYKSVEEATRHLGELATAGVSVFVLNDEPEAYYDTAFFLPRWRIKRVTEETLAKHYQGLDAGAWDRKARANSLEAGRRQWESFIKFNALEVVQLLEVVPYRIDRAGPYDAQLTIDVGHDRRHFALSILIARGFQKHPSFQIVSHVHPKPDHQRDAINPVMLTDGIVGLFQAAFPRQHDPLESVLILRDGRLTGDEPEGINNAMARLKESYLTADARVDVVDVHKDSLKSIRLWEIDNRDRVSNPLEGSVVQLNPNEVVLTATGAATLTQSTADPIVLVGNGRCAVMLDAARANFEGAQLNWSSPQVAQRLHLGIKRTDDDLKARAAQEIRRLR